MARPELAPPDTQPRTQLPVLGWVSRLLPPALVLAALVVAAGITGGLGSVGVPLLLAGIVGVPGLIYKGTKPLFRRRGIHDRWRVGIVAALMLIGTAACFLLALPSPVPQTVAALLIGNVGLVFFRRWLNVSAHVSVMTFAVLWVPAIFGTAWAWLLILAPLMILSRVSLREHSWAEAVSGALLGVATFGCFLALLTQR
ncbi:hypothetical protein KKR91_03680 [Arthrobacter jiangjiafuii]|uniref:PAP2 superfamily protein n=1 Tax=Arthrobacter jiangjiafuii TaxID=2817475 RepID=A0A975M6D3_9MICC|nr:hypothetical protein [Arthrobacter jiangjiafuii]QWC10737.1 hypothetical protein KKR91_03680 [Arthrobacter jiangjiafuii]